MPSYILHFKLDLNCRNFQLRIRGTQNLKKQTIILVQQLFSFLSYGADISMPKRNLQLLEQHLEFKNINKAISCLHMHHSIVQADLLSSVKGANLQQILIKFRNNNHKLRWKKTHSSPDPENNFNLENAERLRHFLLTPCPPKRYFLKLLKFQEVLKDSKRQWRKG